MMVCTCVCTAAYGPMTKLMVSYLAQELAFDDTSECQSFVEKIGGVVKMVKDESSRGVPVALLNIGASRKKLAALQQQQAATNNANR